MSVTRDDNVLLASVTTLPVAPSAIQASVAELARNLPAYLEAAALMATAQRAKFEALVTAGFTEAQALELCK